jgi:hypothetical protein
LVRPSLEVLGNLTGQESDLFSYPEERAVLGEKECRSCKAEAACFCARARHLPSLDGSRASIADPLHEAEPSEDQAATTSNVFFYIEGYLPALGESGKVRKWKRNRIKGTSFKFKFLNNFNMCLPVIVRKAAEAIRKLDMPTASQFQCIKRQYSFHSFLDSFIIENN